MKSFAFLAFILLLPTTFALTASPASVTFDSDDGDAQYTLTITNDESRPLAITLTPNGPLAPQLNLEEVFTLQPGTSRTVVIQLALPDSLQPGVVESGILIEARSASGGTVGATAALMHIIRLTTPQEGAFLAGELLSSSGIVGEEALITLALSNTGSETYVVSPTVFLDGKRIVLDDVTLAAGASKDLVVPWTPRAIGQYEATATAAYAQKQATFGTTITVGELAVNITSIGYGDFSLGDPFRVSVSTLNRWGAPLPVEVRAMLFQNGSRLSEALAVRQTVEPLREEQFTLFLESTGAYVGPATIRVSAIFAGREVTQTRDVILGVDSITPYGARTDGLGLVAAISIIALALASIFIYRKTKKGTKDHARR